MGARNFQLVKFYIRPSFASKNGIGAHDSCLERFLVYDTSSCYRLGLYHVRRIVPLARFVENPQQGRDCISRDKIADKWNELDSKFRYLSWDWHCSYPGYGNGRRGRRRLFSKDLVCDEEGTYRITVRATDEAGNRNWSHIVVKVELIDEN